MTRIGHPRWWIVGQGCTVAIVIAFAGCQPDSPTSARVEVHSASLAKGGGTSGTPTVASTLPSSAQQDTTVDVDIFGSGFANGAAATWSLGGDTTKVHVASTRFVNSTQLTARVVVPVTAPVASYDVVVTLTTGKKGVGAEIFAVTPGDPSATYSFPLNATGLNVTGDGAFTDGVNTVYTNALCGVTTRIYESGTGDAMIQTYAPKTKDRTCASWPRRFRLTYPDGFTEMTYSTSNLQRLQSLTVIIPIGATVKRALHMGTGESARCSGLVWAARDGLTPIPADSVFVTRTAADTWHVQSQPAPDNRAYCNPSGPSYNMAIDFTVRSSRPLP